MSAPAKQLTVDELIAQLQALPAEQRALPVATEGCDCVGPCVGVEVNDGWDGRAFVLLERGLVEGGVP